MDRARTLRLAAATLFLLAVGQGVAVAQAPAAAPPPVDAGLTRQVTLSPAEQLATADGFISKMETARGNVRRQLETARTQRDVVKTLCLNDKLNQIDVAIRSARERQVALQAAAQRSDVDLSNHEFTILSVLNQRSEQLMVEANQCIGQEAGFVGESSVTSTIDPGLPGEDPSEYPNNNVLVDPPACASCIK
jgi:hypothetical protein